MRTLSEGPSSRFAKLCSVTLLALCAFAVFVGSPSHVAEADCNHPADTAQSQRCFPAQFPCISYYFGVDGAPNYPRALKCFKEKNSGGFVALMYLNGEGTPRDLNKAEAALTTWKQKSPHDFNGDQAAILEKAIRTCRRSGRRACPRVDYCNDLAENTLEMEICDAVAQLSAQSALSRRVATITSTLSAKDRAIFDRVVTAFKAYQMREAERGYDAFADGTIRGQAGFGQEQFARDDFLKLLTETIQARKLEPATAGAYRTVEGELEREFRRNVHEKIEAWQEALQHSRAKNLSDQDRYYIENYKKAAQESQLQWIKFRDSCAELAGALYRDHASNFDPAVSMKTFVTKLRIAELRYNPIGPESN